jgi:hypothetical protein
MLQGAKDVCLAAADDVTRQRCMRIIQAASAGASSLQDIASAAALTPGLRDLKSVAAVKAVIAVLGVAFDHPSLKAAGCDLPSLKAAGHDAAAFRAAGCSWADVKKAGFTAAEARAAGCDVKSAQAVGYEIPSLLEAFGYDAVAAGTDLSSCMLVSVTLCARKLRLRLG